MRPELSDYAHLSGGKVREIYQVDEDTLLMVASDRISAFDHALEPEIPDKGKILTYTSEFFFDLLDGVPNHLAGPLDDERIPEEVLGSEEVGGREVDLDDEGGPGEEDGLLRCQRCRSTGQACRVAAWEARAGARRPRGRSGTGGMIGARCPSDHGGHDEDD